MKKYQKLKDLVSDMEIDVAKFYDNGNAAAGTRLRKGLQQLKGLATEIRKEVTELKSKAK